MNSGKLNIEFCGLEWKNPLCAASGTFGFGRSYEGFFDPEILGAIASKGITRYPKSGNDGIRVFEVESGLLNSIGLENPGVEEFIDRILPDMQQIGPHVIANVGGDTYEEYIESIELLNNVSVGIIELNISCPNVEKGGMAFGINAKDIEFITKHVKNHTCHPLMVKLSPNCQNIEDAALAAKEGGADAISLINTIQAMAIDISKRKPIFNNVYAGLSGPAVKPIALRMVHQAAKITRMPICGIGGISSANDAIEFLMAGASVIQIGTAIFKDAHIYENIIEGLELFCATEGINNISEIVGAAV